jgi:DMSO/TMAO reductase YedYZ molybdopterin-dependent catalytic subunit
MRPCIALLGGLLCTVMLVGCMPGSAPSEAEPTPCVPPPIVAPTIPAQIPDYVELDPSTGLHMTGKVQEVDLDSYRLVVTGTVERALSLTYDELRCMPRVEATCTLVCPGFFEDEGTWAGAPITHVLELAEPGPDAIGLRLVSADGYAALATLEMVESQGAFLAYEWVGEPLPVLHGFPVRAVFPESSGSVWVKWLVEIEVY